VSAGKDAKGLIVVVESISKLPIHPGVGRLPVLIMMTIADRIIAPADQAAALRFMTFNPLTQSLAQQKYD
jgi:hypothetical protein